MLRVRSTEEELQDKNDVTFLGWGDIFSGAMRAPVRCAHQVIKCIAQGTNMITEPYLTVICKEASVEAVE